MRMTLYRIISKGEGTIICIILWLCCWPSLSVIFTCMLFYLLLRLNVISIHILYNSLNASLMDNLPSDLEELVVVITHQQFSYPTSFLTQYYEQLLNYSYNERTFQDNQR